MAIPFWARAEARGWAAQQTIDRRSDMSCCATAARAAYQGAGWFARAVRINRNGRGEDRLYSQQRNYIEARIAALMWGVRLKNAVGELDEVDVEQLNSFLQVQQGG